MTLVPRVRAFGSRRTGCTSPNARGAERMEQDNADQRLSQISTTWSLVGRAHQGPAEAASTARQQLLDRYGDAVRRYLSKLLRNPDAVDEVFQEFAVRLIRGDLRGADPQHG